MRDGHFASRSGGWFIRQVVAATAWMLATLMAQQALAQQISGTAQPVEPPPQGFLHWMDNSITVLPYGLKYAVDPEEPSTVTFEHAHDSAIGDLFFFIDGSWPHSVPDILGDDAKFTWYGEVSPRLSVGKLLGKGLSFTIWRHALFGFKDVMIAGQYERQNRQGPRGGRAPASMEMIYSS
jgi:nucleoside-specific outer membrane channel protein Tsx